MLSWVIIEGYIEATSHLTTCRARPPASRYDAPPLLRRRSGLCSYRSYAWNVDNQPTTITTTGVVERYTYDAENARVSRTVSGTTTSYIGGMEELDSSGTTTATRLLYNFGGEVVAQRTITTGTNTVVYLHHDQLGSIAGTTDAGGYYLGIQLFNPWGQLRSAPIGQTKLSHTGQYSDTSGLLYYNSRYYDPALKRFISADTIVPGMAMGAGGALGTIGVAKNTSMKGLTTDYHEDGMALAVNQENQFTAQKGFYFQLSSQDKQKAKTPFGPLNPQALNRYSYVLNNPVRYTDPDGHTLYLSKDAAYTLAMIFLEAAAKVTGMRGALEFIAKELGIGAGKDALIAHARLFGEGFTALAEKVLGWAEAAVATGNTIDGMANAVMANTLTDIADYIIQNTGPAGIAIGVDSGGNWWFMNRSTGYSGIWSPNPAEAVVFNAWLANMPFMAMGGPLKDVGDAEEQIGGIPGTFLTMSANITIVVIRILVVATSKATSLPAK